MAFLNGIKSTARGARCWLLLKDSVAREVGSVVRGLSLHKADKLVWLGQQAGLKRQAIE